MKKPSAKFPKTITILGREFKVIVRKKVFLDGKGVGGTCDFNNKVIEISASDCVNEQFVILCHEATHAFLEITGINQRLTDKEEEMYCQLIAALIQDVIRAYI